MKIIFTLLALVIAMSLSSCGGDVESIENRDPISRLWIPVNADSVDLYFQHIFLNVLDVPIPFYDASGNLGCTCTAFFTGSTVSGVYNMSCPISCNTTYKRFETDNGTFEISDNNILLICPTANRRDLCVEYK